MMQRDSFCWNLRHWMLITIAMIIFLMRTDVVVVAVAMNTTTNTNQTAYKPSRTSSSSLSPTRPPTRSFSSTMTHPTKSRSLSERTMSFTLSPTETRTARTSSVSGGSRTPTESLSRPLTITDTVELTPSRDQLSVTSAITDTATTTVTETVTVTRTMAITGSLSQTQSGLTESVSMPMTRTLTRPSTTQTLVVDSEGGHGVILTEAQFDIEVLKRSNINSESTGSGKSGSGGVVTPPTENSTTANRTSSPTPPSSAQSGNTATSGGFIGKHIRFDSNMIRYPDQDTPSMNLVIEGYTLGFQRVDGRVANCLTVTSEAERLRLHGGDDDAAIGGDKHNNGEKLLQHWGELTKDGDNIVLEDDPRGLPARIHIRFEKIFRFELRQEETVWIHVDPRRCLVAPPSTTASSSSEWPAWSNVSVTFTPTTFYSSAPKELAVVANSVVAGTSMFAAVIGGGTPSLLLVPSRVGFMSMVQENCVPLRATYVTSTSTSSWTFLPVAIHPLFITLPAMPHYSNQPASERLMYSIVALNSCLLVGWFVIHLIIVGLSFLSLRKFGKDRHLRDDVSFLQAQANAAFPSLLLYPVLLLFPGTIYGFIRTVMIPEAESASLVCILVAFLWVPFLVLGGYVVGTFTPDFDRVEDVDRSALSWLAIDDERDEHGTWHNNFLCDVKFVQRFGSFFSEFRNAVGDNVPLGVPAPDGNSFHTGFMIVEVFLALAMTIIASLYEYMGCDGVSLGFLVALCLHLAIHVVFHPHRSNAAAKAAAGASACHTVSMIFTCAYELTLLSPLATTAQVVLFVSCLAFIPLILKKIRKLRGRSQRRSLTVAKQYQRMQNQQSGQLAPFAIESMVWPPPNVPLDDDPDFYEEEKIQFVKDQLLVGKVASNSTKNDHHHESLLQEPLIPAGGVSPFLEGGSSIDNRGLLEDALAGQSSWGLGFVGSSPPPSSAAKQSRPPPPPPHGEIGASSSSSRSRSSPSSSSSSSIAPPTTASSSSPSPQATMRVRTTSGMSGVSNSLLIPPMLMNDDGRSSSVGGSSNNTNMLLRLSTSRSQSGRRRRRWDDSTNTSESTTMSSAVSDDSTNSSVSSSTSSVIWSSSSSSSSSSASFSSSSSSSSSSFTADEIRHNAPPPILGMFAFPPETNLEPPQSSSSPLYRLETLYNPLTGTEQNVVAAPWIHGRPPSLQVSAATLQEETEKERNNSGGGKRSSKKGGIQSGASRIRDVRPQPSSMFNPLAQHGGPTQHNGGGGDIPGGFGGESGSGPSSEAYRRSGWLWFDNIATSLADEKQRQQREAMEHAVDVLNQQNEFGGAESSDDDEDGQDVFGKEGTKAFKLTTVDAVEMLEQDQAALDGGGDGMSSRGEVGGGSRRRLVVDEEYGGLFEAYNP